MIEETEGVKVAEMLVDKAFPSLDKRRRHQGSRQTPSRATEEAQGPGRQPCGAYTCFFNLVPPCHEARSCPVQQQGQ
eukprot:10785857-Prorocentrum_lima.AAC.1